ncbi:DUF1109 domain-containing protein [Bradyrhizobium sp. 187]|jgi:hypothetical protein|uniref:NrsF family protein n=1 Tax=Bradyrhizobium sp. 187 TaxID=2782655 RepID=UPI0020004BF9|nr:DUF1109 domain-containing protein [Bradyrhizobium sp. 187]UPJ71920.1 DUF1109 domain-containing protein [Bradyrhizobium sp. 187]
MTSTDDLIHSLASTAGTRRRGASLQVVFAVTGVASLAFALLLLFSIIGIRHDFADMAVRMPFAFKVFYAGALVVGASVVALYAATPSASATALYAVLPATIFLACGVMFDPTGFPIMGMTSTAAAICVGRILFLSLPAMILTFVFMWKAAPTQPLFAGAVLGMLSGSIGALAYTLACRNDGTAFVAIWYAVACAIMAAVGAIVGHRVLRW